MSTGQMDEEPEPEPGRRRGAVAFPPQFMMDHQSYERLVDEKCKYGAYTPDAASPPAPSEMHFCIYPYPPLQNHQQPFDGNPRRAAIIWFYGKGGERKDNTRTATRQRRRRQSNQG
jgi:hypothetical protein